jgi:glycosyltransferase involved in cell wall biosynthesis
MTMLSIVIPTYNMQEWLPIAIESCLWQTRPDFEVIALNDGSTDRSAEIAQNYARRDSRIRVISQSNAGLGAARQAGQNAAHGDYITWLDADDFLAPNAVEIFLGVAESDKVDMVCANAVAFSHRTFNARRYFYHPSGSGLRFSAAPDYWKSKVVWRWIFSLPFIKRHNLRHNNFKLGQDVCFMYDALTRVDSFSQASEILYYFRQEHKNASTGLEVEVEHELRQFITVKQILLQAGYIKPLIKYLNENYLRDVKNLAPRMTGADAVWLDKSMELGLELFSDMDLNWFSAGFLAPELRAERGLLPLAKACIEKDYKTVRALWEQFRDTPRIVPDKTNYFHTLRHKVKAVFNPLSRRAKKYLGTLEARAAESA